MKALRRSIKGDKDKGQQVNIPTKSAVAIQPPKKVIRALYDYEAQSAQELSFSRGDFFHVIGRENDTDWYEACNPGIPDARGLVPVAFFQALGRTERDSANSDSGWHGAGAKNPDHDSGYAESNSNMPPTPAASQRSSKIGGKSGAMVYGIVMYDFQAERPDELEAKAGEAIIVIAQSNPEWFVAKPISRLGGPGLIPVSFVEIRDMASNTPVANPQDAIHRAGVPRVEEWKKMAAEYKNSSITLGKFEVGGAPGQQQQQQQPIEQGMERMSLQQGDLRNSRQMDPSMSPQGLQGQNYQQAQTALLAPMSARIPRYCFAEDKYWFVVEAVLEDGRTWELSRYYEDFYDFQIALLTEFPAEAGNTNTQKRTLPYMPGPVNYVTDAITEGRLHNLDAYVKNLLGQPEYISRCNLVRQFFAPREGDYEIDPNEAGEDYRLSEGSGQSSAESPGGGASRQSSKNNLNGNGYGGLSAAPAARQNGQPPMARQGSSLSQPSQTSLGTNQAAGAFKVKLHYHDDTFLIRVPHDINFQQLSDKIRDRVKVAGGLELFYKDEKSGDRLGLVSDNDLNYALEHNEKLVVYVESE